MSIVACVKVYDGIVLGAESMSQLFGGSNIGGQPQFVKAFSNARKLFQIQDLPFGVLAYGAGNIGRRSVESLLTEFNEELQRRANNLTLTGQVIATELLGFIRGHYQTAFGVLADAQKPTMGFFLAGYSPNQHLGTEWEFVFP